MSPYNITHTGLRTILRVKSYSIVYLISLYISQGITSKSKGTTQGAAAKSL